MNACVSEFRKCTIHHASFFLLYNVGFSWQAEKNGRRKRKWMDTNHSDWWTQTTRNYFSFSPTENAEDDDGRRSLVRTYNNLTLMRCLYASRQNANISSVLILLENEEEIFSIHRHKTQKDNCLNSQIELTNNTGGWEKRDHLVKVLSVLENKSIG